MEIKELIVDDVIKYNELALSYGSIFNTIEWTNIFGNSVSRYGIYNKGGELIGGFVIYEEKRFSLTIYRDPPYTPTVGPFLKIDARNPVSVMDTWKRTLTLMADFIENLPYSVISFPLNKNIIDMQPFIWRKFKVIPGYTYIIDLSKSEDKILQEMSFKRRNHINRAVKDGLMVRQISDFGIVRNLAQKTFMRQKKNVHQDILDKILFEFSNDDNSYAFATYRDERPIAASYYVYDTNTVYQVIAGYDHEHKHRGAEALVVWEAVKHARSLGFKYFDFEGSMIPQVEIYFRGFGGQLTPFYKINKARLPIEILLKFFKRELF